MDFESRTDPVTKGVSSYRIGEISGSEKEVVTTVPLLVHSVEFNDELINPLPSDANSYEFISIESYASVSVNDGKGRQLTWRAQLFLSGELHIESRTVYNFWDLLGDVGGFHDGLGLVASLFMGFFAELAFEKSYLHGKMSDGFDG